MEGELDIQLDKTMNAPGVTGVICTDQQGLCLGVKGESLSQSAGLVTGLAQQAALLSSDGSKVPVVCLEYEKGNILIKSEKGVSMAVRKVKL
ncbi:ragulator complex protein LAMTOR5-like [Anneissia japonica]|uniref:ragulator complex protein LAMTOR5-like n=1 Tax=Anneissia japonica TaxID=1529436 RepID=UPI0014258A1B|nr:ragulator complex protein LAMTOR5-like [Anneissia japonica]